MVTLRIKPARYAQYRLITENCTSSIRKELASHCVSLQFQFLRSLRWFRAKRAVKRKSLGLQMHLCKISEVRCNIHGHRATCEKARKCGQGVGLSPAVRSANRIKTGLKSPPASAYSSDSWRRRTSQYILVIFAAGIPWQHSPTLPLSRSGTDLEVTFRPW